MYNSLLFFFIIIFDFYKSWNYYEPNYNFFPIDNQTLFIFYINKIVLALKLHKKKYMFQVILIYKFFTVFLK